MEKMLELWQLLQVRVMVQEVMVTKGITITGWSLSLPLAGSDVKVSTQVSPVPQLCKLTRKRHTVSCSSMCYVLHTILVWCISAYTPCMPSESSSVDAQGTGDFFAKACWMHDTMMTMHQLTEQSRHQQADQAGCAETTDGLSNGAAGAMLHQAGEDDGQPAKGQAEISAWRGLHSAKSASSGNSSDTGAIKMSVRFKSHTQHDEAKAESISALLKDTAFTCHA